MDRKYKLYVHISPSGKRYYGITSQENINKRWQNGYSYKHNDYFTNAINKYGWDNFTHETLFNNLTESEAKLLEQCYISLYDTTNRDKGYNITLGGEGSNGLKHTEEWKQQHSKKMSGENNPNYGKHLSEEYKNKISISNKGKKRTEEWKQEHSKKMSGENHPMYGKHVDKETKYKISMANKGKKRTEEAKQKMSRAKSGENNPMYGKGYLRTGKNHPRAKSIICLTTGRIFFTAKEAAEYYNMKGEGHISSCCRGKLKSAGKLPDGTKLVWRYLNYKHNKTYRVINNKEVA